MKIGRRVCTRLCGYIHLVNMHCNGLLIPISCKIDLSFRVRAQDVPTCSNLQEINIHLELNFRTVIHNYAVSYASNAR